jgi:hypothetical protein
VLARIDERALPVCRRRSLGAAMKTGRVGKTAVTQVAWLSIKHPNAIWNEDFYALGGAAFVSAMPKSP